MPAQSNFYPNPPHPTPFLSYRDLACPIRPPNKYRVPGEEQSVRRPPCPAPLQPAPPHPGPAHPTRAHPSLPHPPHPPDPPYHASTFPTHPTLLTVNCAKSHARSSASVPRFSFPSLVRRTPGNDASQGQDSGAPTTGGIQGPRGGLKADPGSKAPGVFSGPRRKHRGLTSESRIQGPDPREAGREVLRETKRDRERQRETEREVPFLLKAPDPHPPYTRAHIEFFSVGTHTPFSYSSLMVSARNSRSLSSTWNRKHMVNTPETRDQHTGNTWSTHQKHVINTPETRGQHTGNT